MEATPYAERESDSERLHSPARYKGDSMTTWSKDELRKIAGADDLHISPFREDGVTYGTPTWIWSVAVDDALYVRGYNGKNSSWYRAAVQQRAGKIIAAGMTREVTFEPVAGTINAASTTLTERSTMTARTSAR